MHVIQLAVRITRRRARPRRRLRTNSLHSARKRYCSSCYDMQPLIVACDPMYPFMTLGFLVKSDFVAKFRQYCCGAGLRRIDAYTHAFDFQLCKSIGLLPATYITIKTSIVKV